MSRSWTWYAVGALSLAMSAMSAACARTEVVATDERTGSSVSQTLTVWSETPHAVTLGWDAAPLGDDVVSYLVQYGADEEDVRAGLGSTWDIEDDPNLGWRVSPFGAAAVQRTTVSELDPGTSYFFQLWVWRDSGTAEPVAETHATTPPVPAGIINIFTETETQAPGVYLLGFSDPALSGYAHTGANALWFDATGDLVNATIGNMDIDVSAIDDATWANAYLELFVEVAAHHERPFPQPYLEVKLNGATAEEIFFAYPAYATVPTRLGWHRIEVPLSAFVGATSGALTPAVLGGRVTWMLIGAVWGRERRVWMDDIVIRY
ncbi:MAG: fibronectin type III domain-containing protein [Myxococcota bacterium]